MTEIEPFFSATLSRWYRMEVMVFFAQDFRLEAVAFVNVNSQIKQRVLDLSRIRGFASHKQELENRLLKAAAMKQTVCCKAFERKLFWGEITGCDSERNLRIELEMDPGERLMATCPLNRIGMHERFGDAFSIGRKRTFHLRRVEPVLLNGTPRLKIVVDRTSKTLVETLLQARLSREAGRIGLRCVKRYVGHKSIVLSTRRLRRSTIIAVDRELRERVQVRVVKTLPDR